jgi:hypothetical protein
MAGARPWAMKAVGLCMALGVATTALDWVDTRLAFMTDSFPGVNSPAFRYQLRSAYGFVVRNTPRTAIVQHNPERGLEIAYGVYGERQVAAADYFHGPLFAVQPAAYRRTADDIAQLFRRGASPDAVAEVTSRYGIGALVVDSTDPAWADREGWVWKTKPDFASDDVRVYLQAAGRVSCR